MKEEAKNNNNTTITVAAENSAEGDTANIADGGGINEEEKIEEDETVNHLADAQPGGSSSNGKIEAPDNERADADALGETKSVQRNNNGDAASSSQKGTVVEIPDENNISAQEDAAVLDDGDEERGRVSVTPGFMFIPGPGYSGRGIFTGYQSGSDDDTNINEADVILQGFLPEDDPARRRKKSNHEILEGRVQRLIDNAITLDDSAVQPIPLEEDGDEEENVQSNSSDNDDEVEESNKPRWFLLLLGLATAMCIILAIALPLSLRGEPDNSDTSASLSDAACLPGEVDARFEKTKSILSIITSPNLLHDKSTPQGKAIRWIVCDDS
eukprot:scaffold16384_cov103-Skeletonema_menzelii.AAC.1